MRVNFIRQKEYKPIKYMKILINYSLILNVLMLGTIVRILLINN